MSASLVPLNQADQGWEADLDDLEAQIDSKTRAILINNPNNPCGSVYSREHIAKILLIAEKHRLPIVADEVYGDVVSNELSVDSIHSLDCCVSHGHWTWACPPHALCRCSQGRSSTLWRQSHAMCLC